MSESIFDAEIEEVESSPTEDTTPTAEAQASDETQPTSESPKNEPDKEPPFHEHPRWKQVMEERKQEREQLESYKRQFQDMDTRLKALQPKEVDPNKEIVEMFEKVDPKIGKFMQDLMTKAQSTESIKAELAQFKSMQEHNRIQEQNKAIDTEFSKLAESNKVPKELQNFVRAQVILEGQHNKNLRMEDLPDLYKRHAKDMLSYAESLKRDTTKSYIADKSKDSKAPASQPKGQSVKAGGKPAYPTNPGEARAQVVQNILQQAKASRDVG